MTSTSPPPGAQAGSASPQFRARMLLPILAASAFLLTLAGSALKNTVQVYFVPMAESFGGSRGALALATTLFAITVAVASPLVGGIADRIGGAATLAIGTGVAGLAFVGCALTGQLWLFIVVYGAVAAFAFAMLSFVPLGVLVDQLFAEHRKGLVYALLTNGAAVGFIVLVPLWSWLDGVAHWRSVLLVTGLAFLFLLTPLAALVARRSAELNPAEAVEAAEAVDGTLPPAARRLSFADRLREAARARELRVLALAFFSCGVTMAFIDVHFVPMVHDHGAGHATSSSALVLLGIAEVVGGLLAGWLCDRGWIRMVLVSAYALRGVAMLTITLSLDTVPVLAFGVIFGVSYLATVVATTMWAAKVLPVAVRGTGMGLVWTVHAVGTAIGSQAGASLADLTGSYAWATTGSAMLAAASCLLIALTPGPRTAPADR
ncbi:MFS transporter [Streptomyces sp. TRM70308]|uniref:MFS transporter n=1 Tax=Streptomyces TaxID=1883 RepID=UPI002249813C|nr:MFS transporter [Streptomyces sp. JHD 1]MCX2971525.1 MFS transporter [Streptomyces sp. JHD 1]